MHHYQRLEKHPGSPSEQRGYIVAEKENPRNYEQS
jgi:hypothetical protein